MFGINNSNNSSDPRIGTNIFANSNAIDVSGTELDTLAYSASLRDHDESTLFSSDAFLRKYGLSDGSSSGNTADKGGEGWSIRVSTKSLLLCVGLAVGIFLACIASIGYYTEEDAHIQITSHDKISTTDNTPYKHYDAPFRVPYECLERQSFNDPISNFMDVSLFHPSLLYRGQDTLHGHVGWFQRIFRRKQGITSNEFHNNNSGRRRRLTKDDPKPFLRVPFPTGAFWTNLVMLPRTAKASLPIVESHSGIYSYPIVAYPYSFQWSSLGKLQVSYSASRRVVEPKMIHDEFAPDITIGSVEEISTRNIVQFDSLSVTLRFYEGDDSTSRDSNLWETYIVQGSPYITILYSSLTPALRALSDFNDITCPLHEGDTSQQQQQNNDDLVSSSASASTTTEAKKMGICDIAINSSRQKKVITGVQFVVTTKEGLTWLIFASEPITFEFDQDIMRTIQSTEKYNGVIRLALVPPSSKDNETVLANDGSSVTKLSSSSGIKRLIYHSSAYPIGGTISWDFRSGTKAPLASSTSKNKAHRRMVTDTPKETNIATISFAFDTHHMTSSSPSTNVQLLMLALPHHAVSISSADELLLRPDDFDLYYHSIKGRMVPIVGNTWSYEEELTSVGFGNDPKPVSTSSANRRSLIHEPSAISALDQSIRDLILKTVQSDLKINLPDLNGGAYSFGKQIARLAQLAHIAEVVDSANLRIIDAEVHRIKNITTKDTNQSPDVVGGIVVGSSETKSGTTRRAYALLEKYLTMWLGDEFGQSLVYDAQLGGIISKVGTADINADFGNSRYNDHREYL
jgi:endoglucanase Acf2